MTTVLILENDRNLRTLLREELEDEGYCVLLAKDEREALDYLKKIPPDLIIVEHPIEPSKHYKTLLQVASEVKNTPVIIYTGYPRSFIDYVWYGNAEHLTKSSDLGNLKQKIAKMHYYKNNTDGSLRLQN